MTDPYSLLGVRKNAADEEIRHAYRKLAKKYHPDNFSSDPVRGKEAEERMKAINDAYQQIRQMRKSGSAPRGERTEQTRTNADERGGQMRPIRILINEGQTARAEALLDAIPNVDRGGEWNFLRGCVLVQRGWYYDAQKYLETACYLDPDNAEYRSFLQNLRSGTKSRNKETGSKKTPLSDFSCSRALCDCFGGEFTCC